MQIRWTGLALYDLEDIADYISLDNPLIAEKIVKIIWDTIQMLKPHPNIGRPERVKDTRELIINGIPFVVPYRIKNNEIQILRVLHTSRKWPDKL